MSAENNNECFIILFTWSVMILGLGGYAYLLFKVFENLFESLKGI